jgi:hypothetical protein
VKLDSRIVLRVFLIQNAKLLPGESAKRWMYLDNEVISSAIFILRLITQLFSFKSVHMRFLNACGKNFVVFYTALRIHCKSTGC